jgi:hypothetical protein
MTLLTARSSWGESDVPVLAAGLSPAGAHEERPAQFPDRRPVDDRDGRAAARPRAAPTSVAGTEATSVFSIGEHTVRQIRYDDGGTLRYTFEVTNEGRLPLTLPEEVHTGSPREAFCPRSTATSRPPG